MKFTRFITLLLLTFVLSACTSGQVLNTRSSNDNYGPGELFDVILYGMDNPHDVETIVVLDRKGDPYQITPAISLHTSGIYRDQRPEDAAQKAMDFLDRSLITSKVEKRSIIGPAGEIIGYEFVPFFYEFQLDNSLYHRWYSLGEDNVVTFYVTWNSLHEPFSSD